MRPSMEIGVIRMEKGLSGEPSRTRTVSWQDPAISVAAVGSISGIEFLRKIMRGELPHPPIADVLGFHLAAVDAGFVAFEFEPAEFHYNPLGAVHGGQVGLVLDSAMACSVHSTLPQDFGYTTLEFKMNFVRPVTMKTGLMRSEGRVLHAGSRIATAEGKLFDRENKIFAHATTTCLIFPLAKKR